MFYFSFCNKKKKRKKIAKKENQHEVIIVSVNELWNKYEFPIIIVFFTIYIIIFYYLYHLSLLFNRICNNFNEGNDDVKKRKRENKNTNYSHWPV